ncbi:hypothetical protein VPH35_127566 [Triticum aestivum]
MLYPHQRQGLGWLWFLHCRGTGGILGDDMGLGKTMQMTGIPRVAGGVMTVMMPTMLVCIRDLRPLAVAVVMLGRTTAMPTGAFRVPTVTSWRGRLLLITVPSGADSAEVGVGTDVTTRLGFRRLRLRLRLTSCPSGQLRRRTLLVFDEGGVVLTTYDIVRINYKLIRGDFYHEADDEEERNLWDYAVLDEAHQIKNPKTQRFQSICDIPCVHRIAIRIVGRLIFYFCCPEVLGDRDEYSLTLLLSCITIVPLFIFRNEKDATNREKHIGSDVAKTNGKTLAKKNELIIWLKLTDCQRQLYEAFLKSDILNTMRPPLPHITILKKICDHPLILTKIAAEGTLEGIEDMDGKLNGHDMVRLEKMALNLAGMSYDDDDDDALQVGQEVSCKLSFMSLLRNLLEEGHHVLIFSQTCKMLNHVQQVISVEGYKFFRIYGTTKISERERIVKDFQEGSGTPIFLLTTKVGGLGLTLTKADRVIVVDPAWNPSVDSQAGDRAYRIGQTKDVIVYRLMTAGTVEEQIYRMQVFKWGLFRTATEQKEQTRYFNQRDIQELLSLPAQGFDISPTQKQLQKEHEHQLDMDESLRQHIEILEQQGIAGVSHHSLLYSKTEVLPALSENDHAPDRTSQPYYRTYLSRMF